MPPKHVDPRKVKYFEDRLEFFIHKCKPDDKTNFVFKTFLEVNKDGWSICTNGRIATILEKMMPFANQEATGCIMKAFMKELDHVFNTKFAHHVLHAALRHCTSNSDLKQDELIASCISDYLEYMWEKYPTFLQDPHAAPGLRVYLQLLSGVIITKSKHTGLYETDKVTLTEPLDPSYLDKITDFANRFLLSEEFNTLLIICWKRLDDDFANICSHILRKSSLLKPSTESVDTLHLSGGHEIKLPLGFCNPVSVFFLETLIGLLPGKVLQKFVKRNLLTYGIEGEEVSLASALAGHGNACRVLRAAISASKKATDVLAMLAALEKPGPNGSSGLAEALSAGQHYLLTCLAKACATQNSEAVQFAFEKMVLETFGYALKAKKSDSQLVQSIVTLKRRDSDDTTEGGKKEKEEKDESKRQPVKTNCVLPGCLLAEEMLAFTYHRPTRLAASLAALDPTELYSWARHQMLHRVIEAALQSPSVPVERKLGIFTKLETYLGQIATDPSGSRIVEAIWRATDAFAPETAGTTKEAIARALAPLSDRLVNSKYGRFVENLVSSAVYRSNPERWRNAKSLVPRSALRGSGGNKRTDPLPSQQPRNSAKFPKLQ